ncbi:type II toxin-antitoxin system RelE/ParE family toxin [Paludibacterium purpuratum]|uniref:Addiction module RelE/StbE family toxin n=1 Tax=Paludibacterium purpuratum TaxID=1144873 RepID=A0A4R7B893_9NEIS|nr:addiction module RelE/StbE family toxin [Paludibacterium purpuratum]
MQVRWLKQAIRNLAKEVDHIAAENPSAARSLTKAIRESTNNLMTFPAQGRPGRVPGTRELVVDGTPYLIPYRVKGDVVQILRVFHIRRKLPTSW